MQYPAENAAPFEFARPILLLAVVAFVAGFGGYVVLHPAPAAVAGEAAQPMRAQPPQMPASMLRDTPADRPEKT
jgi:hypothetical protein